MSARTELFDYCEKNLLKLDEAQFAAFGADVSARPLSDYNVGQVFTIPEVGTPTAVEPARHYLVPNPPSAAHAEFHDLRQKWQEEASA